MKITKLLLSNSHNPYYNLAIEEWAIRNIDTSECDYLFLYQNTDCVVVGRNQNIFQEVNIKFCQENNIDICRRVSGGGTVYHDLGNLNWTFITKFSSQKVNDYTNFSASIISVLKSIGLDAYLNKRNAIMVGDFKISGQAQFTNRKNILSHGTLLYNSNIEKLNSSTINNEIKVNSKASKSVRSDVKTIYELLKKEISLEKIISLIKDENNINNEFSILDVEIQNQIIDLVNTYKSDKWIYERSSKCTIEQEYNGNEIVFEIEKGIIISIKNKKGEELNQHPFLYKSYLELLRS